MRKYIPHLLVAVLAAFTSGGGVYYYTYSPATSPEVWEVHHSPNGGCTAHVVEEIDKASKQIRVWSYSFTSQEIADALIRAKLRGVDVQVVIDAPSITARASLAEYIALKGIPVYADHKHAIQHQKVMAIDGTLLFGSFNWTASAELRNSEVLVTLRNCRPEMYAKFLENWELHKSHSQRMEVDT